MKKSYLTVTTSYSYTRVVVALLLLSFSAYAPIALTTTYGAAATMSVQSIPCPTVSAITARGENLPNEGVDKLIDGNTGSKWLHFINPSASYPTWFTLEFSEAAAIAEYSLTSANDSPSRDPRDWIFQGSFDNVTWDDLDTRTGETFTARFQTKTYSFTNTTGYSYYRLLIQETASTSDGIVQLAEFEYNCQVAGKVAVGNYVFMDMNDNGTYEGGTDMPIENVVVELYAVDADPGVDAALASTMTSATGYYYFDELNAGNYIVYIPASNFGAGQPLENRSSYPGVDATDTSDVNENGSDTPVNGGFASNTFTLRPNTEPTGEDQTEYLGTLDDESVNGTIDFAFYLPPCQLNITTTYSDNCSGDATNGYTADWNIGISVAGIPDNAISYQRNSEAVQSHVLTGTTDTLMIAGIPADGGVPDTLKVWFTNEDTCGDTTIITRPLPCPPNLGSNAGEICSPLGATDIAGTVWEDWNYDGIMNEIDTVGVASIQVLAYDCDNNLAGTAYTDANGNYQFTGLTVGEMYRIEFVLPYAESSDYSSTFAGVNNGTTVQFVQPSECASLGLANPDDYCEPNPPLAISCYVAGDPLAGGTAGTVDALIAFDYLSTASPSNLVHVATASEVGATWGLAWIPEYQKIFSAAFVKRHVGLGPLGLGGVYVSDFSGGTPATTPLIDLDAVLGIDLGTLGSNAARGLTSEARDLNRDPTAFAAVGKQGLGDIDIDVENKKLYVVNLFERNIIEIDLANYLATGTLPSAADVTELSIGNMPDCNNGVARPFGLKVKDGRLYVTITCTAENTISPEISTDDLTGTVMTYDPVTSTWSTGLNTFSLNYEHGTPIGSIRTDYLPWTDDTSTNANLRSSLSLGYMGNDLLSSIDGVQVIFRTLYRPSPLLSDIEFDVDGDMIIGIMDRGGHQWGGRQPHPNSLITNRFFDFRIGGDILRANNDSGIFTLEADGTTTGGGGCGENGEGIDGPDANATGGEYYCGDNTEGQDHHENSVGSLALLAGSGQVVLPAMNPLDGSQFSGGVIYLNNSTGLKDNAVELYRESNGTTNDDGSFVKANSFGDVELLCNLPPLEIGNYVWCDSLLNGIQDACERGIDDIIVQLYDRNGVLVGQDTTVNGQYYFNENNVDTTGITVAAGVASPVTAWSGMSYSTQYFIVFGEDQFTADEFTVGSETYGITSIVNASSNDNIDSDVDVRNLTAGSLGERPDGLPFIDMTTGATGFGDHKYDLGVTCTNCFGITALVSDRVICSGELVDTLAVTTIFLNPDSIAFVYFTTPQTDPSLIYTGGTGIDTVQISTTTNTVMINDIAGFTNTGTAPSISYYVYAIVQPAPIDVTCRPYDEILVVVNSITSLVLGPTVNPSTCSGTEGTIQISGMATNTAYTLNFEKDGVAQPAQNITSDASGNYLITGLDAADYTAINVTANECTSNDVAATLTDPSTATVTVADPFAICSTAPIDLLGNASITPAVLGGNWTSDGTGQFLDAAGDPITSAPNAFGVAVNYLPSEADKRRGFVTLTLTSNTPTGCEPQSSSVRIEILKVDCGEFLWDGQ